MKNSCSVLIMCIFFLNSQAQDTLTLYSTYQGKNIFVGNPSVTDSIFCACRVIINGTLHLDNVQKAAAFEIDLCTFKMQDSITIQIIHSKGCKPKILNPSHYHHFPFKFKSLKISQSECFVSTIDETPTGKIVFEIFRYHEWIEFRTEKGKGSKIANYYTIPFQPHSGKNMVRVKYISKNGQISYSSVEEYHHQIKKLELKNVNKDTLILSFHTEYELMNESGKSLCKASGNRIPMNRYQKGIYFLNADNQTFRIKRK